MDEREHELRDKLRDIVEVARRYCAQIDHATESSDIDFLRGLLTTLPELYWRGQLLPDIDPWPDDDDEDEDDESEVVGPLPEVPEDPRHEAKMARYFETRDKLALILGDRDYHRLVFNPYSPDDSMREPVTASLSDLLADVYTGVLDLLEKESEYAAVEWNWHWRFDINQVWGRVDLLPALNAIHWLVNSYWDEYEDKWQETWTPKRDTECSI